MGPTNDSKVSKRGRDPVVEQILSSPTVADAVKEGVSDVRAGRVTKLEPGQKLGDLTHPPRPSKE